MCSRYYLLALQFLLLLLLFPIISTVAIAQSQIQNSNSNHSYYYYDQPGPVADINDPMHIKAQQQAAKDRWISTTCDKGNGEPFCYNVGYYSGVAEAMIILKIIMDLR